MSAYATISGIRGQVSEETLTALTDDEGTGAVAEAVVEHCIGDASSLIDGYARGRYPVPFSPVPGLVSAWAADIAIYHLYSRRTHVPMPEVIKDRMDKAMKALRLLAGGKIVLDEAGPSLAGAARFYAL